MKKFFFSNETRTVLSISFLFYFISSCISLFLKFDLFQQISGFFLALFIPGFAIQSILKINKMNWINKIIAAPLFTIFFFIPFYYLIVVLNNREISFSLTLGSVTSFSVLAFILNPKKEEFNPEQVQKLIYFGIFLFFLVHLGTILTYSFLPESDGYSYIIGANKIISSGRFDLSYRPLFSLLTVFTSLISSISPYWLFKAGFVALQLPSIYYLAKIIEKADIKNNQLKYLSIALWVAIPMINLEIDYIRPNSIFIAAVIPLIYFLSEALEANRRLFVVSLVISLAGLLYHEFFVFLLATIVIFELSFYLKKFTAFQKLIFLALFFIVIIIALVHIEKIPILKMITKTLNNITFLLNQGITWQWWFIDSYYNMDGNNMGWKGFWGAIQYYAYFLSPAALLVFIFYFHLFFKKIKKSLIFSLIEKISFFLLVTGLIFSEFLPRINFKTLPDRFWVFTALALIVLSPFVFAAFEKFFIRKAAKLAMIILIALGAGGSIYVARAKAGYTSQNEYETALWIKNNLPAKAIFVSQACNFPMIEYFAQRKMIMPDDNFFFKEKRTEATYYGILREKLKNNTLSAVNDFLAFPKKSKINSIVKNLEEYEKTSEEQKYTRNYVSAGVVQIPENIYVLYSKEKFNNYYAKRNWWKEANFYEADLDKFNDGYELIYNKNNSIFIWKKK